MLLVLTFMHVAQPKFLHKVIDSTFPKLTHTQWPFSCDITDIAPPNYDVHGSLNNKTMNAFRESLADQICQ